LNIYPPPVVENIIQLQEDSFAVYFVKQRWHTGIVFKVSDVDSVLWKEISGFKNFKFVDVGWGDEEFYQHPDFDVWLAVKALFYPTASTLRVEGFNIDINRYIEISDIAAMVFLSKKEFDILCKYISDTYYEDNRGNNVILNKRYDGNIIFYKAAGNYHLFNTCNTWAARGLQKAGIKINPSLIILAEDLFHAIDESGIILKSND